MAVYKNDANMKALYLVDNNLNDYLGLNNLTGTGSPTFNAADKKQGTHSVDFEATVPQYGTITDGSQVGLDILGNISVGAWVKLESAGSDRAVLGKWNTGSQRSYMLYRENTGGTCVFFLSSDGTNITGGAGGATVINTATWYHLVGVYNGTDVRVYVNGVLDTNGANNPSTYSGGIFNSTASFQLGNRGDNGANWDGLVDEAFVMNRALSAAEVLDVYTNTFQDPSAGGIIYPNRLDGMGTFMKGMDT